jgi:predicted ester cyclase
MSTEQNKAAIRRVYEEAFNKADLTVLNEVLAPNKIQHSPGGIEFTGPEAFGQYVTMMRTAFPDLHITVENLTAEGDYVAHRASVTGTHRGKLRDIPPTGKRVAATINTLSRFVGDKEVEAWQEFDTLSFYQQLGIIPPMSQAGK